VGGCAGAGPSCGWSSLLLRPMIRMSFCSCFENERADTGTSGSSSSSFALFHLLSWLRSIERVEEALRFREYGRVGASSVLLAAADVKLGMLPAEPANETALKSPRQTAHRCAVRVATPRRKCAL
jgi:hypothetical protein